MEYVFLLYGDETAYAQVSPEQRAADTARHYAFFREIRERNIQRGGAALQPTTTATTVRVRAGKTLTIDGPFAETKEQLADFSQGKTELTRPLNDRQAVKHRWVVTPLPT